MTSVPFNQNITSTYTGFVAMGSITIAGGRSPYTAAFQSSTVPATVTTGDVTVSGSGALTSRAVQTRLQAGASASTIVTIRVTDSCGVNTDVTYRVTVLRELLHVLALLAFADPSLVSQRGPRSPRSSRSTRT